jgi:hypothetical protein
MFPRPAHGTTYQRCKVKKQQMKWDRHTVQSFLDVRVYVLNGTLENASRHWHQGFRSIAEPLLVAAAA